MEIRLHEDGSLLDEELHSRQVTKHLVHHDEKEGTNSEMQLCMENHLHCCLQKNLKQSWLPAFWKKIQNTQEIKENAF